MRHANFGLGVGAFILGNRCPYRGSAVVWFDRALVSSYRLSLVKL